MSDPSSATGLSPLDQIRLMEAEVARKIIAAREASEHSLAEARAQAALIKKQARETGEHEGQIRYKSIIAEAEDEAQTLLLNAHSQSTELHQQGIKRMEFAVQETMRIVLGQKEGSAHEP